MTWRGSAEFHKAEESERGERELEEIEKRESGNEQHLMQLSNVYAFDKTVRPCQLVLCIDSTSTCCLCIIRALDEERMRKPLSQTPGQKLVQSINQSNVLFVKCAEYREMLTYKPL
jgi:hypothetical protein